MKKHIAKSISYALHPLLMPLYAMLLILYASFFGFFVSLPVKKLILYAVVASTIMLPIAFILLLRSTGVLSNIHLKEKRERVSPILFTAFAMYLCHLIMRQIPNLHPIYSRAMLWLMLLLLLLAIITRFWKISLHMAGIGGLVALAFSLSLVSWFFPLFILFSGILGSSRLYLKAHNLMQISAGFLLGFGFILFFLWR